jgi:hypothetical protein
MSQANVIAGNTAEFRGAGKRPEKQGRGADEFLPANQTLHLTLEHGTDPQTGQEAYKLTYRSSPRVYPDEVSPQQPAWNPTLHLERGFRYVITVEGYQEHPFELAVKDSANVRSHLIVQGAVKGIFDEDEDTRVDEFAVLGRPTAYVLAFTMSKPLGEAMSGDGGSAYYACAAHATSEGSVQLAVPTVSPDSFAYWWEVMR